MIVTGGPHAGEFLRLLGNGEAWGIDRLTFSCNEAAGGIAEALGLAERFVGEESLCVMLGDNVFEEGIEDLVESFAGQGGGARVVLVREGDVEHLRQLGVPEFARDGRLAALNSRSHSNHLAVSPSLVSTSIHSDVFNVVRPSGHLLAGNSRSRT